MRYTDYTFYKNSYSGSMPEAIFNRLSVEASAYIKSNTFGRINENGVVDDVKYCMCSLADKMLKIEKREGKKSESVGSWSISYVESTEDKQELFDILRKYLSSELLYRGC